MLRWAGGLKLTKPGESLTTTKAARANSTFVRFGGRSGWAARGVS
jgi:hypothetical protein